MVVKKNRSRDRRTLRHLNQNVTRDESRAVRQSLARSSDIASAILGVAGMEGHLEQMIRKKLKNRDDDIWNALTLNRGPLSDFKSLIDIGFAMGLYGGKLRDCMHTLREVRNTFAHSKRLLSFQHEDVGRLLRRVKPPRDKRRDLHRTIKQLHELDTGDNRMYYLYLCMSAEVELIMHQNRSGAASIRNKTRSKKWLKEIVAALMNNDEGEGKKDGILGLLGNGLMGRPKT